MHLLLRKTSGYVVVNSLLGAWGFKRGLPLSLGVSGPSGPDCVFGDFLHIRKFPRVWAAQARKILAESSEKEPCSFSCPHKMKSGFAVSLGADLRSPTTRVCRVVPTKACAQTFYEIVSLSAQAREGAKLLLRTLCENDCGLTQPAPAGIFAGGFLQDLFCRVASRPCTPGSISYREEMDERRARNLLVP